jgi:putative chitinase
MDTFYLFILKFVPDEIWLSTHSITKDLGDFTGMIYVYSDEGTYVGKVTISNGISMTAERHSCDDEGDDGNGGSTEGSGGGSTGGGGGGSGGWDIYVDFEITDGCWCDGNLVGSHDCSGSGSSTGIITIGGGNNYGNSFSNEVRHPCEGSGSGGATGGSGSCTNVGTCEAPLQFNQDCECKPLEEIENNVVAVNPAKDGDCDTSKEDLKKIFPNASDTDMQTLASVINEYGKDLGVNTKEELQHFLSQAGHETGGFNQGIGAEESLYYTTSSRLKSVYKNYFWQTETDTLNKRNPDDYLNNSSKVANYVYADRMGNGNEASEDGYKYRGRGVFQLTGKTNYSAFKDWYNGKYDPDKDFVTNPEILKNNDTIAIISALWFYKKNVLDKISLDSTTTVKTVTKKVNGGLNGLSDRKEIFQKAKDSITCIQN